MTEINFNSVKEFISWLIDNERNTLFDDYGRSWKYENFNFYFSDLGCDSFEIAFKCLHLHKEKMFYL